ncbi:hypothetical protein Bbelb_097780 [Branchiostoma belcheri]|nr:hypothetical protein Bbelb_097780 [Branchiostoma belcheri]
MERLKSEDVSTHRPFGLAWLDSCLHETLLPNTPWQKVQEKISERFARRIEKQLNHSDRRQMIFELLGEQFVEKYFPKYPNNPTLIEPPAVDPARKDVLKKEAQAWLQQQLYKAARDVGCQRAPGQDYQADTAPEMVEFVEHTYQVFYTGMDRQLVIEDQLRQVLQVFHTGMDRQLVIEDQLRQVPGVLQQVRQVLQVLHTYQVFYTGMDRQLVIEDQLRQVRQVLQVLHTCQVFYTGMDRQLVMEDQLRQVRQVQVLQVFYSRMRKSRHGRKKNKPAAPTIASNMGTGSGSEFLLHPYPCRITWHLLLYDPRNINIHELALFGMTPFLTWAAKGRHPPRRRLRRRPVTSPLTRWGGRAGQSHRVNTFPVLGGIRAQPPAHASAPPTPAAACIAKVLFPRRRHIVTPQRDYRVVCSRLLGKQLPGALRMYVWTDVLMKEERRKIKDHSVNVEKMLRERFGRGIVQGVQALKLKSATRSPISGLVENAVIEMYDRTPGMQAYSQPEQLKEAARVLNILYTYDRSYEPYLIHWLFPLQLVYREGSDQEEHPYELAMYLKLLVDSRFPKWPEVFAIAERVMDRLKQEDRHLHRHLLECSLKNVSFDPKDFLVQLIHKEKEQAQSGGKGGQKPVQPSPELLANPLIFVRKWVGEGFVSVLDAQAVLLVWDQAFMTDWKHKVLEDFCLVILLLLRDLLLQATDYHTMKGVLLLEPCRLYTADIQRGWMCKTYVCVRRVCVSKTYVLTCPGTPPRALPAVHSRHTAGLDVLMSLPVQVLLLEPCRLYTADIQRGWMHLQQGGLPADLPTLNRRRPRPSCTLEGKYSGLPVVLPTLNRRCPSTAVPAQPPLRTRPEPSPSPRFDLEPDELGPVGLRNFKVKLILLRHRPGDGASEGEEDWVAHFDHKNVRLTASVYFGDIKLRSKSTLTEPRLKDKKQNLQSNLGEYVDTYSIEFKEDLVFNNLDPSQFHGVDFGPDSQPYAIKFVRASYRGKGEDDKASVPVNLGWVKIPVNNLDPDLDLCSSLSPGEPGLGEDPASVPVNLGWVKIPVYRQELSQDAAGEGGPPMRGARPHWDVIEGEQTITVVPGNVPETAVGKVPRSFTDKDVVREGSMLYATVFDPSADQKGEDSEGEEESDADVVPTVDSDPFVFFNPETAEDQPPVPDNSEGIDLYVDRVQFIPDNATIIKVTGRVMKSNLDNLPDISAKPMSHDALVLLRVYTVDKDSKTLLVIGSCLFPLFVEEDGQTRFNVGGHQLRLRRGMPDTKKPLLASSLDNVIPVPGASILLRLMPHGEEMIPAPPYKSGFYHSEKSRPNLSEMRILRDFQSDTLFPLSVREAIHRLQIAQGMPPAEEESDAALEQWYRDRLDAKKHLPPRTPASHSDLLRAVRYHIQTGIGIQVEQAHGVNGEGLYVNVFARVSPGAEARELENTPEGYGGEDKIITTKHDFTSLQKSPKWLDPPSIIHPHLEPNTCLLIQVFGLDAVYTPHPDGTERGTVTGKRGQDVRLTTESQLGWTAVPLFDRGCVMAGVHNVPLFMGMPSTEFLTNIAVKSVELSMKEALNTGSDRLCKEYSSLVVKVYDAHYNPEECIPIPIRDELLKIDNVSKFKKTMGGVKSKPLSQLVLQSLDKKLQKQGTSSEVYQREEGFYDEAMGETFYNLMENALMNAGYGPL